MLDEFAESVLSEELAMKDGLNYEQILGSASGDTDRGQRSSYEREAATLEKIALANAEVSGGALRCEGRVADAASLPVFSLFSHHQHKIVSTAHTHTHTYAHIVCDLSFRPSSTRTQTMHSSR